MIRLLSLTWLWLIAVCCCPAFAWAKSVPSGSQQNRLTIQLSWSHQTQFAGFYLAQRQGYFAAEGLEVVLEPGNARENPIAALHAGRADVAISALLDAIANSDSSRRVTNIAQIFQETPLRLICRPSLGVSSPRDLRGKTIGVSGGDTELVRQVLRAIGLSTDDVRMVPRDGTGRLLLSGEVACITGVTYNELLRVQDAIVPSSDLVIFNPESFGIMDLSDGLYVRAERLESLQFRRMLAGMLRALDRGWRDARDYPWLAVTATLERNPALSRDFQHQAIEQVLAMVPPSDFGLLRPAAISSLESAAARTNGITLPPYIWTHRVWNEWQRSVGNRRALTPATRHALASFSAEPIFSVLVLIGSVMFGLGGCLLGIERGYNFWGRLLVSLLPAMGGGVVRDLLIGGSRLPLYFISDPTLPICVLVVVLLSSALVAFNPQWPRSRTFAQTMLFSGVLGGAIIAANGAIVAINADVPWVWVPVFAAVSCAGGGLLQDIVTNHPPRSFSSHQLEDEELALIGGLVLVGSLVFANRFEQSMLMVYASPLLAIAVMLIIRWKRKKIIRYYPEWLAASSAPSFAKSRRRQR